MALRLSKSLKEASSKLSGFGLTFTEGVTYNLDELFADKDRDNSNKELVLNVKYETEIKEKVIKRIREEIAYQFTTDISGKEDEIKDKLADVISNAFVKYGCKYPDIPDACKSEINYNMTKYLKSLCTSEDITFFIRFLDIDTVDITYDFEKSDSLKSKLSEYYERYTVLIIKSLMLMKVN